MKGRFIDGAWAPHLQRQRARFEPAKAKILADDNLTEAQYRALVRMRVAAGEAQRFAELRSELDPSEVDYFELALHNELRGARQEWTDAFGVPPLTDAKVRAREAEDERLRRIAQGRNAGRGPSAAFR